MTNTEQDLIHFHATSGSDMKRCHECGALVVTEAAIERHARIAHDGVVGTVDGWTMVY
jgi:hypothetical protein